MAYSKEQWEKAKDYFELGKSLTYIEDTLGINKAGISRRAKKEEWIKGKNQQLKSDIKAYELEKSTIEEKKSTLIEKVAKLSDFTITTLSEVIKEESRISSLITSTATLALIRTNERLTKNTKQTIVKTKVYNDGQIVGEEPTIMDMELSSQDIKNHIDSIDKASVTLKHNPRFAPQVNINNANAQQNVENNLKVEFVKTD